MGKYERNKDLKEKESIENRDLETVEGTPVDTPPNTLDNRPPDPRTNDELNRAQGAPIPHVPIREVRSKFNEFKMNIEAAFHKLSTDIANLGRSNYDPNTNRFQAMEGLQAQLTHIRNAFHAFDFGEDPNANPDVVQNRTIYDRDPLGNAEYQRLTPRRNNP